MKRLSFCMAVLVLLSGIEVPADVITYSVTDLGTLGGTASHPMAVNNMGQVVGISTTSDGAARAFLWQNGVMTNLGVLQNDHGYSIAWDINDAGNIVGASMPADTPAGVSSSRPFLYSNGSMTVLPGFAGRQGEARGINTAGDVVGRSYVGGAFLYSHTDVVVTNLASGIAYSDAYGINTSNQVVGGISYTGATDRGVLWQNGTMTDLGDLPGGLAVTRAFDINNLGQVVGSSSVSPTLDHAYLWKDGLMTDLGVLPGTNVSGAEGINDSGLAVGTSANLGTAADHRAFLWDSVNRIRDLNGMLDSSGNGWTLKGARDISNAGYIVGWGDSPDGPNHGFLLTPSEVPEPSTLITFAGLGAVGFVMAWRRRRRAA